MTHKWRVRARPVGIRDECARRADSTGSAVVRRAAGGTASESFKRRNTTTAGATTSPNDSFVAIRESSSYLGRVVQSGRVERAAGAEAAAPARVVSGGHPWKEATWLNVRSHAHGSSMLQPDGEVLVRILGCCRDGPDDVVSPRCCSMCCFSEVCLI